MNLELMEAVSQIAKERNIKRDELAQIIQGIFLNMIKRKYGTTDNFEVFVNVDKGEVEISQIKKIVEVVTDPVTEISLDEARAVEPDLEVGDDFVEIIDPRSFGRRLITSAKQGLTQRIREAEKEILFHEFKDRIGEIIVGEVRQISRDEILITVDNMEVVMKRADQIYNERFRRGETIRAVIKAVSQDTRGPEVLVSRTAPEFLIRLFELEVPEIYDGILEIKGVARAPGDRAKVAVISNDKRIDPVGACVGLKGVRIQAIVKELNNEKIDVIHWSQEPEIYIMRALSPAKPIRVIVNSQKKTALAVVPDDQVSLAIGKGGQNRVLASQLTGYDIEVVKESEYARPAEKEEKLWIRDIPELSTTVKEKLIAAGYETAEEVLDVGKETLLELKGLGTKTVDKIFDVLNSYYEESSEGMENPSSVSE